MYEGYALIDSSFWIDAINLGGSIEYIEGSQTILPKYNTVFTSLKLAVVLAISLDTDQMPHHAALHLFLHGWPQSMHSMRGPRIFCQRGSNFDNVLWVDPNSTISGPSSARQRNAI